MANLIDAVTADTHRTSRRRGAARGRARRAVALMVAVLVAATGCLPAFRGPADGPKVVLFGDSLLFTSDFSGAVDRSFDTIGWQRSVLSGLAMGVNAWRSEINLVPFSGARATVLSNGTAEANRAAASGAGAARSMDQSVGDLAGAMEVLASVPCVVLVTVNQHATSANFNYWASRYNWAILVTWLTRPNVRVLDWSGQSAGHPDWFSSDGVHFTDAGNAAFGAALAGAVAGC